MGQGVRGNTVCCYILCVLCIYLYLYNFQHLDFMESGLLLMNNDTNLWTYSQVDEAGARLLVGILVLPHILLCVCAGDLVHVWLQVCSSLQLRAEIFTSAFPAFTMRTNKLHLHLWNYSSFFGAIGQVSDQISLSDIILCRGSSPDALTSPRATAAFRGRVDRSKVSRGGRSWESDPRWRCSRSYGDPGQIGLPAGVHDHVNDWGDKDTSPIWK